LDTPNPFFFEISSTEVLKLSTDFRCVEDILGDEHFRWFVGVSKVRSRRIGNVSEEYFLFLLNTGSVFGFDEATTEDVEELVSLSVSGMEVLTTIGGETGCPLEDESRV
jgi:hypothetical protein